VPRAIERLCALQAQYAPSPYIALWSRVTGFRKEQLTRALESRKAVKSSLKTAIRKAREAAAAGDAEKATEYQRAAARQLDKAVSKGVIHKNQAANKKSALASKVESLKG